MPRRSLKRVNKKVNNRTKKVGTYSRKIRTRKHQKGGVQSIKKSIKKSIQKTLDNYKEKNLEKEIKKDLNILVSFKKPNKDEKEQLSRYVIPGNKDDKIIAYVPFKIMMYVIINKISEFNPGVLKTFYTKLFRNYLRKYINTESSEIIISRIQ